MRDKRNERTSERSDRRTSGGANKGRREGTRPALFPTLPSLSGEKGEKREKRGAEEDSNLAPCTVGFSEREKGGVKETGRTMWRLHPTAARLFHHLPKKMTARTERGRLGTQ